MAKKLGFLVNIERCIGCHACEISCKSFYQLEPNMRRRTVPGVAGRSSGFSRPCLCIDSM